MSTYKEIKGQLIRKVSSDPTDAQVGQIWYNTTIGALKGYQTIDAAWASGGNMGTARDGLAGAGTQDAGLAFGGQDTSPARTGKTEEYTGTAWAEQNDLSTARNICRRS